MSCPCYDKGGRAKLHRILDACLSDNVKARVLQSDGSYALRERVGTPVDSQQRMMDPARQRQAEGPSLEKEAHHGLFHRLKEIFGR